MIYDLCIIGAGYAGVNALHAAKDYLNFDSHVLMVDIRDGYAGQWRDQYAYVRLHQPYQHFTAGNFSWRIKKPRGYLANRDEVISHLNNIAVEAAKKVNVENYFKYRYIKHTEDEDGVSVILQSVDNNENEDPIEVRTKRLILAQGFDIKILKPLDWESTLINSMSVSDPAIVDINTNNLPPAIYIIGGGKTAMDCALHLIKKTGGNVQINMFAGRGSFFGVRENWFPTNWRRWVYGSCSVFSDNILNFVLRYQGDNAAEVYQEFVRRNILHGLVPKPENFSFGLVSKAELTAIKFGLEKVYVGHVKSIHDVSGSPIALLEHKGKVTEHALETGAWVINATSHIKEIGTIPIMSKGGKVCAPQNVLFFSGPSAFVITHLLFLGKLEECWKLLRYTSVEEEPKDRMGLNWTVFYLSNLMEMIFLLPIKVLLQLSADYNRWFPWYRQIPAMINLIWYRSKIRDIGDKILPARYTESDMYKQA